MPDVSRAPRWTSWGVDLSNSRFQPSAQAGLFAGNVPNLKLKWAFGLPDTAHAWSQPTIAGGRVFVGSQGGHVYCTWAASE
jgi:polyvinyl alcohol dehydrogenase (cytochrome)